MAVPVVEVEPVLERRRALGVLVAAAHDVEVGMAVAVRVEEHRADVLGERVAARTPPRRSPTKRAVALLDEQLARLPLRAADVEVVEPVAVHVADRHQRPFRRQQLRHQPLAIEVDELVLVVREVERRRVGDVA